MIAASPRRRPAGAVCPPQGYVVITRDEPEGGALERELARLGLRSLHWPVLRIGPPGDSLPFERALANLRAFDWIVFASPRAVQAVVTHTGTKWRATFPCVAAVGTATARALEEAGWRVDVVARGATAASLLEAIALRVEAGDQILLPWSSRALPTLARGLAALGAVVRSVEAYSNTPAALDAPACRRLIRSGSVSAVLFASPSAVDGLSAALGARSFDALLRKAPAIAIGPTTARALAAHGIRATIAHPHTLRGLALAARHSLPEAQRS